MKSDTLLLAALVLIVLTGCSNRPDPHPHLQLVPAHGVVRINGRPVDSARVTFSGAGGVSAYGVTDADGKFKLTTFKPDDGAAPGSYKVTVTKAQGTGHPTEKTAPPAFRRGVAAPQVKWLVPQQYSNLATSGLTGEVTEDDKEIVLDLRG
jgi:hypothetical protein